MIDFFRSLFSCLSISIPKLSCLITSLFSSSFSASMSRVYVVWASISSLIFINSNFPSLSFLAISVFSSSFFFTCSFKFMFSDIRLSISFFSFSASFFPCLIRFLCPSFSC
uniref:Uncharacterized protein n=1 Tax=Opuntia streptacantha TaxID=393608 RepID=A0A7C8YJA0_OPUST